MQESGFVDYITMSSNILFSGKNAADLKTLKTETFYNRVIRSKYNADDYLLGVERVSDDYRAIFEEFKNLPNVVFLIDPPYLSTDCKTYKSDKYWKLTDYLDVIKIIDQRSYFYFTSNKSQIIELCEWIGSYSETIKNPFSGAEIRTAYGVVNFGAKYTDIMIFKNV